MSFPANKTLDQFNYHLATGIKGGQIEELAGLGFFERREDVTLVESGGSGKARLAMVPRLQDSAGLSSTAHTQNNLKALMHRPIKAFAQDAPLTTVLIDRLLHPVHIVAIAGHGDRLKNQ